MKIITGFEEELSAEGPSEAQVINEDFIRVFKAIQHDIEVAENAFTRAAKRAFKKYSEGGVFTESKDARDMRPTWVSESTVVLPVGRFDDPALAAMAADLQQLVVMLGKAFESTTDEPSQVSLIDPLKCRIQRVTDLDYKFTIKQMWAPQ
jgi:hypothetical protein